MFQHDLVVQAVIDALMVTLAMLDGEPLFANSSRKLARALISDYRVLGVQSLGSTMGLTILMLVKVVVSLPWQCKLFPALPLR